MAPLKFLGWVMVAMAASSLLMAYPFVVVMVMIKLLELAGSVIWPAGF